MCVIVLPGTTTLIYFFNSSITETLTYGLFATFSNGLLCSYATPIILWQVFYYCLIAYRFKLQLKLENNRLLELSTRINRNIAPKVMNCFQTIDRIDGSIRKFDRFWSKITFIFVMLSGLTYGISISELFGNVDLFMKIILMMRSLTITILITTLFVSASLICVEAKKTHRILYKLITHKGMAKNLRFTFKVNFILKF